jgi:quinolinate synthase
MLEIFEKENHSLAPIPEAELSDEKVLVELKKLKEKLQEKVIVLGHHYQQDDVISFADIQGDSLELARRAQKLTHEYIMFCGVHFMAETADMLTSNQQKVILPDMRAGCSMADMADRFHVQKAWDYLTSQTSQKIIPITYVNSSADLKAFVGKNNGSICTSSNAKSVLNWAFQNGEKILFFPDQHLGRNTAFAMGVPLNEMVIFNPHIENGGLTSEQINKAKIILWYGYCSVHQGFKFEHISHWRKVDPARKILVHPECSFDVVQASDLNGSTSFIVKTLENAKAGEKFAIGTEINLVNRLQSKHPELDIKSLSPYQCLCTTMYRVRPRWLLESFRAIDKNKPINIIKVDEETRKFALLALDRMLNIS